jgi:hypothetical protein
MGQVLGSENPCVDGYRLVPIQRRVDEALW